MKAPSESTLMSWWRRAVKATHGDRCVFCGATPVECHHVIHRRHKVLRYDAKNGLPLCVECHTMADTIKGREMIASHVDMDYLRETEQWLLKDWLRLMRMTREEFLQSELDELKRVVAESHHDY